MTETLTIARVGGQGDGIAETPDGPALAPLTLPGETVRGEVRDGRLQAVEILTVGPDRVAPVSPHYGDCGGCSLQHWASGPYLDWQREQVRLALARERIETEVEATVCPVADPRLVAAFPALSRIAAPFLEHPKSAPTLHVTWTLTGLDVDVTGVERRSGGLSRDAQMRAIQAAAAGD